jgi:L-cysteine:1D-myo-inositol 2-amino-2-deoxy-alpha-D-glucopyranoside ligase
MAIRLALLAHHYRSDWVWTDADLREAEARLTAWRAAADRASHDRARRLTDQVRTALADDLDAPRALAAVDAWAAGETGDGTGAALLRDLLDARLGVLL